MRKAYKIEDVCCANCAAKIQDGIAQLDGVNKVSVNFLTEKMLLDAEPEKLNEILEEAQKIFTKYEPDSKILV